MAVTQRELETNYYRILGVERGASDETIRRAFRRAAPGCHPDTHPGDHAAEERFKRLNEAHQFLTDESKRAVYDRYHGIASENPKTSMYAFFDLRSRARQQRQTPDDNGTKAGTGAKAGSRRSAKSHAHVKITLDQVLTGTDAAVVIGRQEYCPECRGSGNATQTSVVACPECNGSGYLASVPAAPCAACNGLQKVRAFLACRQCLGQGRVRAAVHAVVRIPAGIESGAVLVVPGQGDVEANGDRGAAAVTVTIAAHPYLLRAGKDVHCDVQVTIAQAALGTTMRLLAPGGRIEIKVPRGSGDGRKIRVKGAGLPLYIENAPELSRGDLVATVRIQVPRVLTERQKQLLEALEATFAKACLDPLPPRDLRSIKRSGPEKVGGD